MKGTRSAPLILLTALLVLRGIPRGPSPAGNPAPPPGQPTPSLPPQRKPRWRSATACVTWLIAAVVPLLLMAAAVFAAKKVIEANGLLERPTVAVGMFGIVATTFTFVIVIFVGASLRAAYGAGQRLAGDVWREIVGVVGTCAKAVAATAIVALAAYCLALRVHATDGDLKDKCGDSGGMVCQWSLTGDELSDMGAFQLAASMVVVVLIAPFLTANAFEKILRNHPLMGARRQRVFLPPALTASLLAAGVAFGFTQRASLVIALTVFILMVTVRLLRERAS